MSRNSVAEANHAGNLDGDDQSIYRIYEGSFTTISNVLLHNDNLSMDAVGLLCRILSFPIDWKLGTAHLRKKYGLGRDKLWRMLNELKDAGHVRLVRPRDADGRLKKAVYYVAADPRSLAGLEPAEQPRTEKPSVENHTTEKPGQANAARGESRAYTKETDSRKETGKQTALTRDARDTSEGVDWRNRLTLYREKGVWPPKWGPRMGEPGCKIPRHLVIEWNDSQGAIFKRSKSSPKTPKRNANGARHISEALPAYRPGASHD